MSTVKPVVSYLTYVHTDIIIISAQVTTLASLKSLKTCFRLPHSTHYIAITNHTMFS